MVSSGSAVPHTCTAVTVQCDLLCLQPQPPVSLAFLQRILLSLSVGIEKF